jgi:hypothetical protein
LRVGYREDEEFAAFSEERITAEDSDLGAGVAFEDFEDLEAEVIHGFGVGPAISLRRDPPSR